jgi:hypothetical protein
MALQRLLGGGMMAGGQRPSQGPPPNARQQSCQVRADLQELANVLEMLFAGCGCTGSCFTGDVKAWTGRGDAFALDRPQLGRRARSLVGGERGWVAHAPESVIDGRIWRAVHLGLEVRVGDSVEVWLLRPLAWLGGVDAGGWLYLDMPEMGARGWARVLEIAECPELEEGPGRLITGWFKHNRGRAYDLQLFGQPKPIGGTATHLVWSVDRMAWVSAGELLIGERVQGKDGTLVVESFTKREKEEPVYNIEVDGDHCYRVGACGLLVHNNSVPAAPATPAATSPCSGGPQVEYYYINGPTAWLPNNRSATCGYAFDSVIFRFDPPTPPPTGIVIQAVQIRTNVTNVQGTRYSRWNYYEAFPVVNGVIAMGMGGSHDSFGIADTWDTPSITLGPGTRSAPVSVVRGWIMFLPTTDTNPAHYGFQQGTGNGPWGPLYYIFNPASPAMPTAPAVWQAYTGVRLRLC